MPDSDSSPPQFKSLSDKENIELIRTGNDDDREGATAEMYKRHLPGTTQVCRGYLPRQQAEHVAHDTLFKGLTTNLPKLKRMDHPDAFRNWIHTSARNAAINAHNNKRNKSAAPFDEGVDQKLSALQHEAPDTSLITQDEQKEFEALLRRAGLSDLEYAVVWHRFVHDLEPFEVADKLDLPTQKVYNAFHRAKQKLLPFLPA